jgi:hypothetical protein
MLIKIEVVPVHQSLYALFEDAAWQLIERLDRQLPDRAIRQKHVPLMQKQRFVNHSQLTRGFIKGIDIPLILNDDLAHGSMVFPILDLGQSNGCLSIVIVHVGSPWAMQVISST